MRQISFGHNTLTTNIVSITLALCFSLLRLSFVRGNKTVGLPRPLSIDFLSNSNYPRSTPLDLTKPTQPSEVTSENPQKTYMTNCRLQLECASRREHFPTSSLAASSVADSRIRVAVRSARGPAGPVGPQGLRGPPGPPGPKGDCARESNLSIPHELIHKLVQQMRRMETQVAFFAGLELNIVEKPSDPNPKVIMKKVITNVGHAYNAQTGEFVAPVSGVYSLTVAISAQGKSRAAVRLMHNEQVVLDIWSESAPWSTATNQAVLHMEKGDTAWLSIREGAHFLHGYMYSTFSGFLLFEYESPTDDLMSASEAFP